MFLTDVNSDRGACKKQLFTFCFSLKFSLTVVYSNFVSCHLWKIIVYIFIFQFKIFFESFNQMEFFKKMSILTDLLCPVNNYLCFISKFDIFLWQLSILTVVFLKKLFILSLLFCLIIVYFLNIFISLQYVPCLKWKVNNMQNYRYKILPQDGGLKSSRAQQIC